jgi:predicted acetyltransferase
VGDAVPVSIRDCKRSAKDRKWIQEVYIEYLDALADLNTGIFLGLTAGAAQRDEIFANWFANEHSHPLVIANGTDPVGFALVTRPRIPNAGEPSVDYFMSEFFIRQAHRRSGIGRTAAALIFDRFAGEWEIVEYQRNPGSVEFWRKVVAAYARGHFSERARHGEVRQRFRSRPPAFPRI